MTTPIKEASDWSQDDDGDDDRKDVPAILHHGTSWPAAIAILRQDTLKAKRISDIEPKGICFTGDLAVAADFAKRRDGREAARIKMRERGMSRHKIEQWLDIPGCTGDDGTKGVVLTFDGRKLADLTDLEPYGHYGMEEDELRSSHDVKGVAGALIGITLDPADEAYWRQALPKEAKGIANLLKRAEAITEGMIGKTPEGQEPWASRRLSD